VRRDKVTAYREIVAKAVVGKGKKLFKNSYSVTPEADVDTVLGCWVINHKFNGTEKNDKILIKGSCDANIWYSYDNDTKTAVITKTLDYNEEVQVNLKEDMPLSANREIIIRALKQPNCTKVNVKDDVIELIVEKELGIEIVGETKLKVEIETEEEPWEELSEEVEVTEEVEREIEENIEENFI
jgi:spore coat protein E